MGISGLYWPGYLNVRDFSQQLRLFCPTSFHRHRGEEEHVGSRSFGVTVIKRFKAAQEGWYAEVTSSIGLSFHRRA